MKINTAKLKDLISGMVEDVADEDTTEISACIGVYDGPNGEHCELQLTMTKQRYDFIGNDKQLWVTSI